MESIVKSGRTVDEAIGSALQEMGLTRDEVQVDILQLENTGFLGLIGRKEGKVRVTPLKAVARAESSSDRRGKPKSNANSKPRSEKGASQREPRPEKAQAPREPRPENRPPQGESRPRDEARKPAPERPARKPERAPAPASATASEAVIGECSKKAEEVVSKISECFGIQVEVQARETERSVNIRVVGDQVGQLIGRRGRTLGAVQYIVSRLVNEEGQDRRKVTIDVDGYNEDREGALTELAERTAERVLERGKPVFLRPMSPPERRIIHLTLQDDNEVATESVGEQDSRRVVVYPKSFTPEELQEFIDSPPPERSGRGPRRRRRGRN